MHWFEMQQLLPATESRWQVKWVLRRGSGLVLQGSNGARMSEWSGRSGIDAEELGW